MSCCGEKYSCQFDHKRAEAEMVDYHNDKIKKNSRPLLKALIDLKPVGASMLDIGGGIGALDFELFKAGLSKTTHVELSEPFANQFIREAEHRSLIERVQSYRGDFLHVHHEIEVADLVCLDKVICCYENYEQLVNLSLRKARRWYAYVVPRDVWWVRLAEALKGFYKRFQSDPFRTYVHPVARIEEQVIGAGFQKATEHLGMVWQTTVYERVG